MFPRIREPVGHARNRAVPTDIVQFNDNFPNTRENTIGVKENHQKFHRTTTLAKKAEQNKRISKHHHYKMKDVLMSLFHCKWKETRI